MVFLVGSGRASSGSLRERLSAACDENKRSIETPSIVWRGKSASFSQREFFRRGVPLPSHVSPPCESHENDLNPNKLMQINAGRPVETICSK